MVFRNVLIQDNGHLRQGIGIGFGNLREIRIIPQMLQLSHDNGIVISLFLHLGKQLAQIEGLHIDAHFLHGNLVKADSLKRGGAGADAA